MRDKPIFEALLTPHRSLGRKGFTVLALITTALVFAHIVVFLIANAWPVALFLGADLILLFGAFWLNYRAGRVREEILISRSDVMIRKVAASGKMREDRFHPFWAKFNVSRHEELGITQMNVTAKDQKVAVGSFLNPDDRESFARAFSGALATAKRG